jgi:hypothetical protein
VLVFLNSGPVVGIIAYMNIVRIEMYRPASPVTDSASLKLFRGHQSEVLNLSRREQASFEIHHSWKLAFELSLARPPGGNDALIRAAFWVMGPSSEVVAIWHLSN